MDGISRRDALRRLAGLAGTTTVVPDQANAAAESPHLQPNDPAARPFGYDLNAASVDVKQFPTYKPGQMCGTCLLYQGLASQTWGPCNLFPRQLVNSHGWCRAWAAKSG
jgi:hypothetical protein